MEYLAKLTSEDIHKICCEFNLRSLKIAVNNSKLPEETLAYINALSSNQELELALNAKPKNEHALLALNELIKLEVDKVYECLNKQTSSIEKEEDKLAKAISLSIFKHKLALFFETSEQKYSQEFLLKTAEKLGYLSHTQHTPDTTATQQEYSPVAVEELTDPLLLEYADNGYFNLLDVDGNEKNFSIFIVNEINNRGVQWLTRLADINPHSSYIEPFKAPSDDNANLLDCQSIFLKDGPITPGTYGVWSWWATPNRKNPKKTYVRSWFERTLQPIELACVDVMNIEDLITRLRNGIEYSPLSKRTLFHTNISAQNVFTGVLCNSEQLSSNNGITFLKDDAAALPVYKFDANDIIELANGVRLYTKLFAGVPESVRPITPLHEIVNRVVKESFSWSTLKNQQFAKADFKKFNEILSIIPQSSIIDSISQSCLCNKDKAAHLLQDFIRNTELTHGISSIFEKEKELETLKQEIEKLKCYKQEIEERNREQEEFAKEVQAKIAQRIEDARKDAASFIASMAFAPSTAYCSTSNHTQTCLYKVTPNKEVSAHSEPLDIWDDVIDEVSINLLNAGVSNSPKFDCCNGLATFLCAAYILKQPILLVGPNAKQIAEALSYVVDRGRYGILDCSGDYDQGVVDKIGTRGEKIVIVNNLITSSWVNRIQDVFANDEVLFIATHPYKEDLQVEPGSLFNFMIPVLTEFMVVDLPSKLCSVSNIADSLQNYTPETNRRAYRLNSLQRFNVSPLLRSRIGRVFEIMNELDSIDKTTDLSNDSSDLKLIQSIISTVSLAYISMSLGELEDEFEDTYNTSIDYQKIKKHLGYILKN